jgi:tetratricopeptide (TPR) repeat protein
MPTTPRHPVLTLPRLTLGALCLVLAAGCATTDSDKTAREHVNDLVGHGNYAEAVRIAKEDVDRHPDDAAAVELHRETSLAYLLEQGRRLTFADHDLEALDRFAQALSIDPTSQEAYAWLEKTRRKMSKSWLERGLEAHANGDLPQAIIGYQNALKFSPGDPDAMAGLATAVAGMNFRALRGRGYFNAGLRALSEYWLEQARSRFSFARKYEPDDQHPKQRETQVDALLAIQRVALAKQLEQKRRYGAARGEYRHALLLDPTNTEAQEGKARCTDEMRAAKYLSDARMAMLRGRFDEAANLVEQGLALTRVQKDLFEGMQARVREAHLNRMYNDALSFERDLEYEKAVDKYGEILGETDYYKDVLARKDTLEQYIRLAAELYDKAQAATSKDEKIRLLEQIRLIWPEYKDTSEQLKALSTP